MEGRVAAKIGYLLRKDFKIENIGKTRCCKGYGSESCMHILEFQQQQKIALEIGSRFKVDNFNQRKFRYAASW